MPSETPDGIRTGKVMKQNIEKLESSVYTLVQKFETLVSENRRLKETVAELKRAHERQKLEHETAVDELSEALLVQVGKLKEDLQNKIDSLTEENARYRSLLEQSREKISALAARLPQRQETQQ
ncbi:hypothetical protein NLA_2640 [Neisseria lactamica 020-06]|uniref:BZIP transcription factor n=4 Tax=Neisseria TaxID=482 RepID=E4ZAX8_NEIL0|nr:hypothetical protein NLA_2640 [Neisseria lactamica 020-06]